VKTGLYGFQAGLKAGLYEFQAGLKTRLYERAGVIVNNRS
jgi:hypothetical protein